LSGPTSEQAVDTTQETNSENDDEHKELMSKLETLEERVQKLETENQELKVQKSDTEKEEAENQELKKVDTDSHVVENHKVKVPDKDIVLEKKTHLQNDALKLNGPESLPTMTTKDTPADLQLDKLVYKDKVAVEGAHQPANSPSRSDTIQDQQQQLHAHDTPREPVKDDNTVPLQNNPVQHTETNQDGVESHVEKIKTNADIPDLAFDKKITKANVALTLDTKQTNPLTLNKEEGKTHIDHSPNQEMVHEDDHNAEKVPVLANQNIESHRNDADQPKTNIEHLIDQKFEQELLEIKAAEDVGVRSRDLLHSEKHDDSDLKDGDSKDKMINSQPEDSEAKLHVNELGGAPSIAAPIAVNKTVVGETTSSLKRNMLSLKQTDHDETYSLKNGG